MHPTGESDSTVCIIPQSQTPRCATHRGAKLRSVHHTTESRVPTFSKNSVVCIPLRSQAPRYASYRGVKLCGVLPTTESSSAVCRTLRIQAQQCASYREVKLRSVHHTGKSNSTPRSQNRNLWESLVAFKGTIRRIYFRGKLFYHVRKDWENFFLII